MRRLHAQISLARLVDCDDALDGSRPRRRAELRAGHPDTRLRRERAIRVLGGDGLDELHLQFVPRGHRLRLPQRTNRDWWGRISKRSPLSPREPKSDRAWIDQ